MIREDELHKIDKIVADVLQPAHFYIRPGMSLLWERRPGEEVPWEISHGRLVPPHYCRHRKTFTAWNIYHVQERQRSAEPLLSLKLDAEAGQLHVVRAILCYVWEAFDAAANVIDSRETTRWVSELVGTIALAEIRHDAELRAEMAQLMAAAVVGTSRLPLTSVEAPLPGFSLGQLAFFDRGAPADPCMRSCHDLIQGCLWAGLAWPALARLLETILRAAIADDVPQLARSFVERWQAAGRSPGEIPRLLRTVFNDVSLSPWTNFVPNALAFFQALVDAGDIGVAEQADFLGYLLLQLARHLTAYDLSTFHHRGANYPDALLLDACLKAMLAIASRQPRLFLEGPRRRRALRQGWLMRAHYEGHFVPDAPTSPGENARVLPAPHVRVPEEQLLHPGKRRRRLYEGDPISGHLNGDARAILQESLHDLQRPEELRELGLGVFIDRPLGTGKAPGEPDRTPLLSYLAFSRSIASRRLLELGERAREMDLAIDVASAQTQLARLAIRGRSMEAIPPAGSAVVSLADVRRVAEDFLLLNTLPSGLRSFLAAFDWQPLQACLDLNFLNAPHGALIVPAASTTTGFPVLEVFDATMIKRLDLVGDLSQGYGVHRGVETPRAGLIARYDGSTTRVSASRTKCLPAT